jgi:pantoate--beta-alanine ligase
MTLVAVRDVESLRRRVQGWRREGRSVALVPTMGAVHKGHLTLMSQALKMADRVVATIFVNPKQFGPAEDFNAYPRREHDDFELINAAGVQLLFSPDANVMYPPGYATNVSVAGLGDVLCGPFRPGHFNGVATVVAKLLLQTLPDIALFGEKDFQQLAIIKRVVADLNIPVDIIGVPTVREADGLAMSSRNAYLSAEERVIAPALNKAITAAASAIAAGQDVAATLNAAKASILASGFRAVDYVDARGVENLTPVTGPGSNGRVFAAAHLRRTRLIDNVPISA